MNTAGIMHRPESEFAALYTKDRLRIRVATAKDDIAEVYLLAGDPYTVDTQKWYQNELPMTKGLSTMTHDYWEIEVTSPTARIQYGFHLVDFEGEAVFYGDQGLFPYEEQVTSTPNMYFRLPYFHEIDRFQAPDWVRDTVWYQIFPERFANGDTRNDPLGTLPWGSKQPAVDDFFGGDLQGVLDHLDYLVDLGINGIYFCPIFRATSNHKYDTIDYLEIDPDFGDKALFKELVDACHARGIRVMLDAVFNHMGDFSPQWQDVIQHGADSVYADWFHIHSFPVTDFKANEANPGTEDCLAFDTFAFTPHMPKLDTANPEVQEYLLTIAKYWIDEFDIDGWRLDVANEVDHQFWKKFRQVVKASKPDVYILGEIWHSSQSWLQGDEFDAVMNYAFTDSIKDFFITKKLSATQMISGMNFQQLLYRDQTNEVAFNVLDSHDTARLLTLCEGNKELVRSLLTFMFLQKGSPCLYYGTEVGMAGGPDPDCRRCMIWEKEQQDQEMYAATKKLIAFRRKYSDLMTKGTMEWVISNDEHRFIQFTRTYQGQKLTAYFNAGEQEWPVNVQGEIMLHQSVKQVEQQQMIQTGGYIVVVE